jgi:hypothetical protein
MHFETSHLNFDRGICNWRVAKLVRVFELVFRNCEDGMLKLIVRNQFPETAKHP